MFIRASVFSLAILDFCDIASISPREFFNSSIDISFAIFHDSMEQNPRVYVQSVKFFKHRGLQRRLRINTDAFVALGT